MDMGGPRRDACSCFERAALQEDEAFLCSWKHGNEHVLARQYGQVYLAAVFWQAAQVSIEEGNNYRKSKISMRRASFSQRALWFH